MTSFRRFTCDDLLRFTNVNVDRWTETYGFPFYLSYFNRWPELATIAENASTGRPMGYSLSFFDPLSDSSLVAVCFGINVDVLSSHWEG